MLKTIFRRQLPSNLIKHRQTNQSTNGDVESDRRTPIQLERHLNLVSLVFLGVSTSIGSGITIFIFFSNINFQK